MPNFLHVDKNSPKLKVDQNLFGWVLSKMGATTGYVSLKLTVSQEHRDKN